MFIDQAWAQSGIPGDGGDMLIQFLPIVLLVLIFYFLLLRPQQKRAKTHQKMLSEIKIGDTVILGGGLYGKVKTAGDETLEVELGTTTVLVQRGTVAALVPTDAAKAIKLPKTSPAKATAPKGNKKPASKKSAKTED